MLCITLDDGMLTVVDFNGEDKKISLSMKALEAPAEEESVEE